MLLILQLNKFLIQNKEKISLKERQNFQIVKKQVASQIHWLDQQYFTSFLKNKETALKIRNKILYQKVSLFRAYIQLVKIDNFKVNL